MPTNDKKNHFICMFGVHSDRFCCEKKDYYSPLKILCDYFVRTAQNRGKINANGKFSSFSLQIYCLFRVKAVFGVTTLNIQHWMRVFLIFKMKNCFVFLFRFRNDVRFIKGKPKIDSFIKFQHETQRVRFLNCIPYDWQQ